MARSMSGVYGMVRLDSAPVTSEMLDPAAAAMAFWGPDGHGQWRQENAGLGFLGLHTTPESLYERMPSSLRAAPHLIITADARIDNRGELFDALGAAEAGRTRTPDSSLILLAYERWGADCVRRLLGDFVFAIWDARERRLFCARDPLGCRPFFYSRDTRAFHFASDIKGVLACIDAPRLHEPLIAAHLQMKTCYARKTRTFYENILKLPAGHTLTLAGETLRVDEYWSPHRVPGRPPASEGAQAAELRELFHQAVECRVRSAFPVASHLSGGIDSSAVTLEAGRFLRARGRQLATFSWSPPLAGDACPAGEYARINAVSREEGLACEYIPVTAASLLRVMQRDFTVEPMELMPREERVQIHAETRGIRLILSGWGGDEAVTCWWPSASSEASSSRSGFGRLRDFIFRRLPDSIYAQLGPNPFMKYVSPCVEPELARRYRGEVREMQGPPLRPLPGMRSTMLRLLDLGYLSLRMEDWAVSGARHRLVYSYPLLDKRLVEFALSATSATSRRRLFIGSVSDLLPAGIDWFRDEGEAATLAARQKANLEAHVEWASLRRPLPENVPHFVDAGRIQQVIEAAQRSGTPGALQGVREAISCYAIQPRA